MATGEKAAVRWRARGSFTGPVRFEGLIPTGASVDVQGCDVLTSREGRIQRNDAYMNGAPRWPASSVAYRRGAPWRNGSRPVPST